LTIAAATTARFTTYLVMAELVHKAKQDNIKDDFAKSGIKTSMAVILKDALKSNN
jgi:hypothetical protein